MSTGQSASLGAIVAMLIGGPVLELAGQRVIPPPIGPHVNLKPDDFREARSFREGQRLVMTYYFYWYDIYSKEHIVNSDGSDALTTHPKTLDDFSYKSVRWHRQQLLDMMEAGIDVALPVYWGAPSDHQPGTHLHWSFAGLKPLVEAWDGLKREGKQPPRIGLFYDTSTLQHNSWNEHIDLTTERGRQWFFATIRDFYSLIPARMWAMIDDRPIVVLYSSAFARAHDQSCLDSLYTEFPRMFGGRKPYVIREVSWKVQADNVYGWGGAIRPNFHGIGQIGPGYDHTNVPGRQPLIVDRKGGTFYEAAWKEVLRRQPQIVAIETWNEFHEGTDVCESKEYGRKYLEMTRKYVEEFKRRSGGVGE